MLQENELPFSEMMLRMEEVSITYAENEQPAIQQVSFSLAKGEAVLFLGPSGCGKSTLAMLCARLIPRSVEATVSGNVWYHPEMDASGRVGYVFQDPDSQFCMLTVADEVAFGLENQSFPRSMMKERIQESLVSAGIPVPLTVNHAEFSGGMKQKLAIASALALKPGLLILDEPTANLDPFSTKQVFEQIARLHDAGQTMIVIEHKFDPLLPVMDRVVLFDRSGRIYREGPAEVLIREEWKWLLQEGVVAEWKAAPFVNPLATSQLSASPNATSRPAAIRPLEESHHPEREAVTNSLELAFQLEHVAVAFGKKQVLFDLSLTISKGDFVAIVGPNGAGKSTLLQVLAGLKKPASGTVRVLHRAMQEWKVRDRFSAISYSFQNPEFQFVYERVGDELANRLVGDQVPPHVEELLKRFGLEGTAQQSPFSLSQGQKRRLSVAAMMRKSHEIYLFDEPTFGQDANTQAGIMERMRELHDAGKTIIMTTHDMDLVKRYAQHVIVVVNGRIAFLGTPESLFSRPDILQHAHLMDDTSEISGMGAVRAGVDGERNNGVENDGADNDGVVADGMAPFGLAASLEVQQKKSRAPIRKLHPGWLFLAMFVAAIVSLFAHTMPEAFAEMALPLLVMMGLGWMSPWRIVKLLSPFLIFYVLYLWTYVANAAVPPGTASISFLWYHISYYGLMEGLILSIRMLGSVLFGILFVTQIDFTDFMVALTKDFYVPPKFAYGTMAGLRVVPLFSSEWTKLKQARQIRGKEGGSAWLKPITYALPLLSQGIRMSERVAIAMEARGFYGKVTESAKYRTFYRQIKAHWWDVVISAGIVVLAIVGAFL